MRCAFARTVPLPSKAPEAETGVILKEYTRYNGMSLAEVHSEHSAGSAGASANKACPHGPPRVASFILDAITAREEEAPGTYQ